METILVTIHAEDGKIEKPGLEAITAALTLQTALNGSKLCLGIVGEPSPSNMANLSGCGADRLLFVAGEVFKQARYSTDAAAAAALINAAQATIVLAPATSRWNRVLGGVARRVGGCVDTHATNLNADNGQTEATRWFYRQRMQARLRRSGRPWLISIEPGCFAPWEGAPGSARFEMVDPGPVESRTQVQGIQSPPAEQQTIRPDAKVLLVAGAGWTKKQADGQAHVDHAATLIMDFITRAHASLGSSKSLVDMGGEGHSVLPFLTHLNQVGQTGATPRHPKGLSTCCHGEEPHVVGWRFINERRAINLDAGCGWAHGKTDVLYVADAFEVMKHVNAMLQSGS